MDATDMVSIEDGRLTFWRIDGTQVDLGPKPLVSIDELHEDLGKWLTAASVEGASRALAAVRALQ